ncbi:hypothetical protein KSP39_PZI001661 [Platanthera zijinensis]|uniref:Uncharacterized protein n=1 Tax=Platanthera zijinensis TaxID=2320716 RepID=A0AAP0GDS3_9ASPA
MESFSKINESNGSLSPSTKDFSFRLPPAVEGIVHDAKLFHHAGLLPSKPAMRRPPPTAAVPPIPKVPPLSPRQVESLCSNVPGRRRGSEGHACAYERLRRASSDSTTTSEAAARKRPRRLLCVLGVARFPAEMEMKDMKSRQRRLGPLEFMADRVRPRIPWFILHSLSCRAAECTAVSPLPAASGRPHVISASPLCTGRFPDKGSV